jgi:hypothetical protein
MMTTRTAGILFLVGSSLLAGTTLTGDEILAKVADTAAYRRSVLREYTGTRHYAVSNRRFNMEATGTVRMSFVEGQGAHLQVLATAGSDRLANVIRRIADSAEELSRSSDRARSVISPANYTARLAGRETAAGRSCYVLELKPRFKSKHLIDGKAWVEEETFALVRIEGQFAASVSAFLGRPYFKQEFGEVAGFWLPLRATANSSTFLLGASELRVDYLEYEVGSARYQPSQTYAENRRLTSKPTRR